MSELNSEILKYLKVLELKEDTTLTEIKKSYQHLKSLYSSDSPIMTAATETSEEISRDEILSELEDAYEKLFS